MSYPNISASRIVSWVMFFFSYDKTETDPILWFGRSLSFLGCCTLFPIGNSSKNSRRLVSMIVLLMICTLRTLELKGCSGKGQNLGERNREHGALTIGVFRTSKSSVKVGKRITRMSLRDLDSDPKRLNKWKVISSIV